MSYHFLIADDEDRIRRIFKNFLESRDYTYEEASDSIEVVDLVSQHEQDDNPFDLILLDYNFGSGDTGLEAIQDLCEKFGQDFCEHKFIVITAHSYQHLPAQFAEYGSLGHLLKPISQNQFWATIDHALKRQEIYIHHKQDWEFAYNILNEQGLLNDLEDLQSVNDEYHILKETYQQLLHDLEKAGASDMKILGAYRKAEESLNQSYSDLSQLYEYLGSFGYTKHLIDDIKALFSNNRLQYIILCNYLKKFNENPLAYRVKKLFGRADDHYEYRVGRNFRLYFRKGDRDKIVLERFGHKKVQNKIIEFLSSSSSPDLTLTSS